MLTFNEQLERILEVGMVLLVGAALGAGAVHWHSTWFVPVLFLILRPLAATPVWFTKRLSPKQFAGVAWFGIRGIGSIYYLMYAIHRGLPEEIAGTLAALTFVAVACSIVIHGVSVTPLIRYLHQGKRPRGGTDKL